MKASVWIRATRSVDKGPGGGDDDDWLVDSIDCSWFYG